MRTPEQLRAAIKAANVEALAEQADVSTKTLYRIRQSDIYFPRHNMAKRLSDALDAMAKKSKPARSGVKPRARPAEELAEATAPFAQEA